MDRRHVGEARRPPLIERAAGVSRVAAMSDVVLYEVSERIATITINRPES